MLKPGIIAEPKSGLHQHPGRLRYLSQPIFALLIALYCGYLLYDVWARLESHIHPWFKGGHRTRVPSGTGKPAYLVRAKHGAVASENEKCSDIGIQVMKTGGNAVDAAVSTTLCIGVLNMFS